MPLVDEVHHVVHVDGIHLHRDQDHRVAVAGGHVEQAPVSYTHLMLPTN